MKPSHLLAVPLVAATLAAPRIAAADAPVDNVSARPDKPPFKLAPEIDLDIGLQGVKTAWADDHGGGGVFDASFWIFPWLGASYIGKEQYSMVDDRVMSYFSVNAAFRADLGGPRLTGTLGVVHQHEEPRAAWNAMPVESVAGVGDGIRHRMAGRVGAQLAYPVWDYGRGDMFVALDLDATKFLDSDKGPSWQAGAGVSVGATYDFTRARKR